MTDKRFTNDTIARIHRDYYTSGPPDKPYDGFNATGWRFNIVGKRPEPRADVALDIWSKPVAIIRVSVPVRFLWVCGGGHEHRWRVGAWLCNVLR